MGFKKRKKHLSCFKERSKGNLEPGEKTKKCRICQMWHWNSEGGRVFSPWKIKRGKDRKTWPLGRKKGRRPLMAKKAYYHKACIKIIMEAKLLFNRLNYNYIDSVLPPMKKERKSSNMSSIPRFGSTSEKKPKNNSFYNWTNTNKVGKT